LVLSNSAIFDALDDGRLVIEPQPTPRLQTPGGPKSPFDTTGVDLNLAPTIQIAEPGVQTVIDFREPGNVATTLSKLTERRELPDDGWKIPLNTLILAQTAEVVSLPFPRDLAEPGRSRPALGARVEGKSSLARFGVLVHFTAPTIHAGWSGQITLEIMGFGKPLMLYPGMPICQLILDQVVGDPLESQSQFQGQRMPAGER